MAQLISIQIDDREFNRDMNNLIINSPRLRKNINEKVSQEFVLQLKRELNIQGLRDTADPVIYNSLKYGRISRNSYGVFVHRYGIYLDRMRPHWVSLKRGRRITSWFERKIGFRPSPKGASIYVHPHPWIEKGIIRGVKNMRKIAQLEVHKYVESKGLVR